MRTDTARTAEQQSQQTIMTAKLCSDCRFRRSIRDEGDRTPCGRFPDTELPAARKQCQGQFWQRSC